MCVMLLTSSTTQIHEATPQKETDISKWLTDGKTVVGHIITGADIVFLFYLFFVEKRLEKVYMHFTVS